MRLSGKWLVFGAAVVLAVLIPVAVLAGVSEGFVDRQRFFVKTTERNTTSTTFSNIGPLSGILFCTPDTVLSASLNVRLSGGPAEFRVLVDDQKMLGAPAQFDPTARNRSFSFTFLQGIFDNDHMVDVQWRSKTGEQVTLHYAGLNLIFDHAECV